MVHVDVNRCVLDRIESNLSNAPRFKSISHFLVNIFLIEIMTDAEKSAFFGADLGFFSKNVMILI